MLQMFLRSKARCAALFALLVAVAGQAWAEGWTEEVFTDKPSVARPFVAVASRDPQRAHSVIGTSRFYQVQKNDTFLDIARYFDLGYNELADANPGLDPWIPAAGQTILLPTSWVLPDTEYTGVVVNIPEMRLYYFRRGAEGTEIVTTYPVGLGRDDWRTPQGKFRIRGKTVNPRWVLPESIKAEHRRDGKPAPDFIAGGIPENPLGKYRFELTLPMYAIHGTDIPWGWACRSATAAFGSIRRILHACFPWCRSALLANSSINRSRSASVTGMYSLRCTKTSMR